jgi:hypothetical protein
VLIAIKFILQFTLVNPVYELHRDEFLHLDQAFHPAAGYISTPPFTSWIASVIYFFGGGLFWIRFFPAFFGVLTIVFTWLIVEEFGGKMPAKILTSISLIFSIYIRLNVLFQPNAFDILAWTIIFFLTIKYIKKQQVNWLFLLSLIIALALYNKYTIVFLIIGLILGLLLTEQRIVFKKRAFYLSIALSLLIILPNIFWQIKNHFPVIYHMQALNESQLVNVNRIDFLFDQVKYGVIGILTLAAIWALVFFKPFRSFRFIGWTFAIVMILFTISRAKSYYTLGLYPVLFALGSVYLEVIFKKWRIVLITVLALINIVVFFVIVKYLMPFQNPSEIIANRKVYEKMGLLRWEDGKNHLLPQDFADMIGWREMAEKSLIAYKMIPTNELENTLIYCDNYGQTGALNYYNRTKMPEAYSFNTDYIYWLPDLKNIKNIVFIGNLPSKEVMDMFKDFKLVGVVENEFARERGTKIFLLMGANPDFTEWFYKKAEERKRNFNIF